MTVLVLRWRRDLYETGYDAIVVFNTSRKLSACIIKERKTRLKGIISSPINEWHDQVKQFLRLTSIPYRTKKQKQTLPIHPIKQNLTTLRTIQRVSIKMDSRMMHLEE